MDLMKAHEYIEKISGMISQNVGEKSSSLIKKGSEETLSTLVAQLDLQNPQINDSSNNSGTNTSSAKENKQDVSNSSEASFSQDKRGKPKKFLHVEDQSSQLTKEEKKKDPVKFFKV